MAILEFTVSNSKYEVDLFSKLTMNINFFSAWLEGALKFSNFVRTWVSGLLGPYIKLSNSVCFHKSHLQISH